MIIFFGISTLILFIIIFCLFKEFKVMENEIKEYKSVNKSLLYNNQELRKTLQRIEIIDIKKGEKIEEIRKANKNNIVNIINDELSNDKKAAED